MKNISTMLIGIAIAMMMASLVSCTEPMPDRYFVTVENQYFEPLYHVKIGETLLADTLRTDSTTVIRAINKGQQPFVAETASGLLLNADLQVQGEEENIALRVDETGKIKQ